MPVYATNGLYPQQQHPSAPPLPYAGFIPSSPSSSLMAGLAELSTLITPQQSPPNDNRYAIASAMIPQAIQTTMITPAASMLASLLYAMPFATAPESPLLPLPPPQVPPSQAPAPVPVPLSLKQEISPEQVPLSLQGITPSDSVQQQGAAAAASTGSIDGSSDALLARLSDPVTARLLQSIQPFLSQISPTVAPSPVVIASPTLPAPIATIPPVPPVPPVTPSQPQRLNSDSSVSDKDTVVDSSQGADGVTFSGIHSYESDRYYLDTIKDTTDDMTEDMIKKTDRILDMDTDMNGNDRGSQEGKSDIDMSFEMSSSTLVEEVQGDMEDSTSKVKSEGVEDVGYVLKTTEAEARSRAHRIGSQAHGRDNDVVEVYDEQPLTLLETSTVPEQQGMTDSVAVLKCPASVQSKTSEAGEKEKLTDATLVELESTRGDLTSNSGRVLLDVVSDLVVTDGHVNSKKVQDIQAKEPTITRSVHKDTMVMTDAISDNQSLVSIADDDKKAVEEKEALESMTTTTTTATTAIRPSESSNEMEVDEEPPTVPDVEYSSTPTGSASPHTNVDGGLPSVNDGDKGGKDSRFTSSTSTSNPTLKSASKYSSTSASASHTTVHSDVYVYPSWHFVPGADIALLSEMKASNADLRRFRRETGWLEERASRPRRDSASEKMFDKALGLTRTVIPLPCPNPKPKLSPKRAKSLMPVQNGPLDPYSVNGDNSSHPGRKDHQNKMTSVVDLPSITTTTTTVRLSTDSRLAYSTFKTHLLEEMEERLRLESDQTALQQAVERTEARMKLKRRLGEQAEEKMKELSEKQPELELELERIRKTEQEYVEIREQKRKEAEEEIRQLEETLKMLQQEEQRLDQLELQHSGSIAGSGYVVR
ncbi:hypothetical protein BGX28_004115 [Mortierella sp. GBA30]|nr:hypothetical protein BGX28_004115 [Mortierella sp. GBA30]